jgi:large subunit ribosomal protein L15
LKAENVIRHDMLSVKLVKSGKLERKVILKGIGATKGAREAIAAVGGSVTE